MERIVKGGLALLCALFASAAAWAQPAKMPVIVVFKESAPLHQFVPNFRVDVRASQQSEMWGYLKVEVVGTVQTLESRHRFMANHVFSHAVNGFAARLTAQQIVELENDPTVDYVEADGVMQTTAQSVPWGIDRIDADVSTVLAGNGTGAVANVNAYVIDTGVGGVVTSFTSDLNIAGRSNFVASESAWDCNGHGSHVAGTIGAKDNTALVVGVAPGIKLYGIKVLNCQGSGSNSDIIKAIDWVTANAKLPAVANLSLGGSASQAVDDAVRRSVAKGIFYAVSAGNNGSDACNQSPARAGAGKDNGIMTTGATDSADKAASFSNHGSCVDIWAPGTDVVSTNFSNGTATMSGTSQAAPHVAGAAALYLSRNPSATPSQVEAALRAAAVAPGTKSKDGVAIKRLYVGRL